MRSITTLGVVALLALSLGACASASISTDWDRDADFSDYRTFAWYDYGDDERRPDRPNEILDRRIQRAISGELEAKGLEPADAASADLLVTYTTAVDEQVRMYTTGYDYGYWRGYRARLGAQRTEVVTYEEGTVILDLVDNDADQLVWRGTYTSVLGGASPTEEKIREAAAKLLAGFPPGS